MRVSDRWNKEKRDNNWFSGGYYLPHWYYTLFGLLSSRSNGSSQVSSTNIWIFSSVSVEEPKDLAALVLIGMIIFIAFMLFCILPFVVVTANNIWTSLNTLISPENTKDILMALTTLLVVAGVITACVYLFPVISGALVGYAIAHSLAGGLGVAAAVCSTLLIGLIGLSSEMLFHRFVDRTCDLCAHLYSTAIHSENNSHTPVLTKTSPSKFSHGRSNDPLQPIPTAPSAPLGIGNERANDQDLPPSYDYVIGVANAVTNRF